MSSVLKVVKPPLLLSENLSFFRDFIETGCGIYMTEQRATYVTKALAIIFGVVGYIFIFVVKNVGGVLEVS